MTVVERDASGRAVRVELRGERTQMLRGEQLRAILNQPSWRPGHQSTRSP